MVPWDVPVGVTVQQRRFSRQRSRKQTAYWCARLRLLRRTRSCKARAHVVRAQPESANHGGCRMRPRMLPVSLIALVLLGHAPTLLAEPSANSTHSASAPETLVAFDPSQGQLPESLTINADGELFLSMSNNIVKVDRQHTLSSYASLPLPAGYLALGLSLGLTTVCTRQARLSRPARRARSSGESAVRTTWSSLRRSTPTAFPTTWPSTTAACST